MVTSLVDGSLSEGQSRSFYNPSTRSKLKSFEDMTHKTKLKCRSGDTVTVHMNPELVFRRELVIDCNKDMSSLIRVVLEISKNGQYYRNVLFQLMYNICLTGFAHCTIVVKQLCWNRTNWKRQNLFNSNVLSTIKWSHHLLMVLCLRASLVVSTILVHGPS
jgi:hypothetical protein